MLDNKILKWAAWVLVIIGGINWGLVGLFNGNIITGIFGEVFGRIIFFIVGLAAAYLVFIFFKTGSISLSKNDMGNSNPTEKAEPPKETTHTAQETPKADNQPETPKDPDSSNNNQ